MKVFEIILGLFVLLGLAFKSLHLPGAALLIGLFLLFLAIFYFIRSFFFLSSQKINAMEKVLAFFLFWTFSFLCMGINFSYLKFPGNTTLLVAGLLPMGFFIIIGILLHFQNKIDYRKIGITRILIYGGFGLYLFIVPVSSRSSTYYVKGKFIRLNESLERSNRIAENRNVQIFESLIKSVKEKGNKPEDLAVINSAMDLRLKTYNVIKKLDEYKDMFIEETGGYEEGHDGDKLHLVGSINYDGVGHFMMPIEEGGQGHGKEMVAMISEYTEFITQLMSDHKAPKSVLDHFINLTPDAEEGFYMNDPNEVGKKWSQLAFEWLPTPAGLATVSELQASVLRFEAKGLDHLKNMTGLSIDVTR